VPFHVIVVNKVGGLGEAGIKHRISSEILVGIGERCVG